MASACGTEVNSGFQRSSANGPKPPLQGWYAVAGCPLYGREFMQIGVGYGCRPASRVAFSHSAPSRNDRSGGIG